MLMEIAVTHTFDEFRLLTFRSVLSGPVIPVDIPVVEVTKDTPMTVFLFSDDVKQLIQVIIVLTGVGRWRRAPVEASEQNDISTS